MEAEQVRAAAVSLLYVGQNQTALQLAAGL